MKKILFALALLLVVGGAVSYCWPAEKVRFATALKFQAVFAMPMLAIEENGFWKQQGLEAEWVPFDAGTAMHRALAGQAVQLGITDVTGALSNASRGLPIVMVYHMGPVTDYAVWVRADSPIKQPADLKGKRLNVDRLGDASHAYGQLVAKAVGLEGRIRFVGIGGSREGIAALSSGAIDASMNTYFAVTNLFLAGEIRPVVELATYLPEEWMGRVVEAHRDFLKRNPEAVGRALKALHQGTDFVMKNRSWTLEKMQSYSRYTLKAAEFLYPRLTYSKDGRIDKKALANIRQFLIDYGIIPADKTLPLEELYTDRFTR